MMSRVDRSVDTAISSAAESDIDDIGLPGAVGVDDGAAHDPIASEAPDLSAAVGQAQTGDEAAFRLLYRDVQPRVLRYLRVLVGDDAEDVASETWLQVSRDLGGFSGDLDAFRGWVATIARNRASDHRRRASRRPQSASVTAEELTQLAAGDDTAARALDAVATDRAIQLIATLPRDQAEAVLLRVVVGLDAKAAGSVLGKRAGAVRTAAYRGLRKLSEQMEREGEAAAGGDDRVRLPAPEPGSAL